MMLQYEVFLEEGNEAQCTYLLKNIVGKQE